MSNIYPTLLTLGHVGDIQGHEGRQRLQQRRRRAVSSNGSNSGSSDRIEKWGVKDVHKEPLQAPPFPEPAPVPPAELAVSHDYPARKDGMQKRLATIVKSPNYDGEFDPTGTVDIEYNSVRGGGSAVITLNAKGLDPMCMNKGVMFDKDTEIEGSTYIQAIEGKSGKDKDDGKDRSDSNDDGRCL
eukprot:CAMPEP_0181097308 /NCGR_PEP_ID=MMETSP1071-20121207/11496_1 /TAXON_ID=35127 /ORGANISM="Thalassiosira sp., Strain NH16" /LENGTH=184 /DNA_ID=CAMNT_0023179773 /DNA_START=191 /DNA_END=742 /DNA_ORIENTATION=-